MIFLAKMITQYTSYFHDGEILDIIHNNKDIDMVIESAEIDPTLIKDIQLSTDNRIK